MADPAQIKRITDNIEATYQALRKAAANISGLLAVGRASCEEIKAYNLWALATYNAQRGMLLRLRQAGEKDVPALPAAPTLFTWKGVSGQDAWKIDCGKAAGSLSGALAQAMAPKDDRTVYLSPAQIQIVTTDPQAFNPAAAPSLAQLAPPPGANGNLGIDPITWVIIAGILIGVGLYVGIPALAAYLKEAKIQEETSSRMRTSAQAFATYTSARMQCLQECTARGGDPTKCVADCDKLIARPELVVDPARAPLGFGFWATVGLVVVVAAGGALAFRYYTQRRGAELPA